jgi:outer membrane protein TolC
MTARLWQWTAALGLNQPPDYRPAEDIPDGAVPAISVEECLGAAQGGHPDLLIQQKALEAARYGDKAARSLYWPMLSASGFYGRSGGAFKGETLELREDWNAGLQLSQYFGGNTANVNGQQVRTSPKIGQTTRTESKTISGTVGVMDGLRRVTEKKDAALTFHQAEVQMERTRMEVSNGVRESYANWKKALAGLKIAENELALAKTDHSIAGIKSAHREVPLSERAVSRNKLAAAEVAFADAQAGYQIAGAALSRAVGDPDFFDKKSKETPKP